MISLMRADLRRILNKRSFQIVLGLTAALALSFVIMDRMNFWNGFVFAVNRINSLESTIPLIMGLALFIGVYADEFQSKALQAAIGRGLPRRRLILVKIIDCTVLTAGITLILSLIFAVNMKDGSGVATGVSGILLIVFGAATAVLSVISLVLMIIGTIQCARDEASFKMIIYLTIVNVIVAVIAAIFSQNMFLTNLASAFSDVISFVCSLLVVLGIGSMAAQLGDQEVMEKCATYFKIVLGVGVLSLLIRFFAIFWGSLFAQALVFTFVVISIVLCVMQYVLYLGLLAKTKKMLAEQ